jgi:sodium transport system permease protein
MLTVPCAVARKELADHVRDRRAIVSTALYTLMGPAVVWLVLAASGGGSSPATSNVVVPVMAAVFTLIAALTGSMSVAADLIAGERERRSLLPLLLNARSRFDIVVGKWLAAGVFAAVALFVCLVTFAALLESAGSTALTARALVLLIAPLAALAAVAAAMELLVSTLCRNLKEANTYLGMLIFVVMGVAMWLAFRPQSAEGWWFLVPIAGHERLLQLAFVNGEWPLAEAAILAASSLGLAFALLACAAKALHRDSIVHGD